ncbi:unnamed protein product [Linum trigynum]|uniref:Uncharacterized protein n=1 Tax=Linum trigynum TaxID=586398 RepID=A0AAV2D4J0_9ROSI
MALPLLPPPRGTRPSSRSHEGPLRKVLAFINLGKKRMRFIKNTAAYLCQKSFIEMFKLTKSHPPIMLTPAHVSPGHSSDLGTTFLNPPPKAGHMSIKKPTKS